MLAWNLSFVGRDSLVAVAAVEVDLLESGNDSVDVVLQNLHLEFLMKIFD